MQSKLLFTEIVLVYLAVSMGVGMGCVCTLLGSVVGTYFDFQLSLIQ